MVKSVVDFDVKDVRLLNDIRADMWNIERTLNNPFAKDKLIDLNPNYRKLYEEMMQHPAMKKVRQHGEN